MRTFPLGYSATYSLKYSGGGGLWDDGTPSGNGWVYLSWFGYINLNYDPWIYHLQHRWMFPVGQSTVAGIWLYTFDMEWLWTSQSVYPWMYRRWDGAWLFYVKGTENPRWFFNNLTSRYEAYW